MAAPAAGRPAELQVGPPSVADSSSASSATAATAGSSPDRRSAAASGGAAARAAAAAAVLKRFSRKLEGRDPDLCPRGDAAAGGGEGRGGMGLAEAQTVEQQVEALLREARGAENLSRMYEGWTPWL